MTPLPFCFVVDLVGDMTRASDGPPRYGAMRDDTIRNGIGLSFETVLLSDPSVRGSSRRLGLNGSDRQRFLCCYFEDVRDTGT